MASTLTAHLLLCNFNTASVADNAFVTDTLVLTAMAFIVFNRTKNTLAEQTVTLRLIRTVIDGFRL